MSDEICPECGGNGVAGFLHGERCPSCEGSGSIEVSEKTLEFEAVRAGEPDKDGDLFDENGIPSIRFGPEEIARDQVRRARTMENAADDVKKLRDQLEAFKEALGKMEMQPSDNEDTSD